MINMRRSLRLHHVIEGGQAELSTAFSEIKTQVEKEHRKFQEVFHELFHGFDRIIRFQKIIKSESSLQDLTKWSYRSNIWITDLSLIRFSPCCQSLYDNIRENSSVSGSHSFE